MSSESRTCIDAGACSRRRQLAACSLVIMSGVYSALRSSYSWAAQLLRLPHQPASVLNCADANLLARGFSVGRAGVNAEQRGRYAVALVFCTCFSCDASSDGNRVMVRNFLQLAS